MTKTEMRKMLKEGGRRAHAVASEESFLEGIVKDGFFHVSDSISNGVSYRDLTDEGPEYEPIPLSEIAAKGHEMIYFD